MQEAGQSTGRTIRDPRENRTSKLQTTATTRHKGTPYIPQKAFGTSTPRRRTSRRHQTQE